MLARELRSPSRRLTRGDQLSEFRLEADVVGTTDDVVGRRVGGERLAAHERRSLVADVREARYQLEVFDAGLINNDSFSYDTTVATSGTQNVREVFAELLVPVLKDLPLIDELSLDLGARPGGSRSCCRGSLRRPQSADHPRATSRSSLATCLRRSSE